MITVDERISVKLFEQKNKEKLALIKKGKVLEKIKVVKKVTGNFSKIEKDLYKEAKYVKV